MSDKPPFNIWRVYMGGMLWISFWAGWAFGGVDLPRIWGTIMLLVAIAGFIFWLLASVFGARILGRLAQ